MSCQINLGELPTLESLLGTIEALQAGTPSFELFLPWRVSFQGRFVSQSFAKALVHDRLLQQGLVPVRVEQQDEGKLLTFAQEMRTDRPLPRTEPHPIEITRLVPALAPLAKHAIRLHPRRAVVPDLAASKLGGTFLWPRAEPWPRCDDKHHQTCVGGRPSATDGISPTLVPLVQLNAADFPEIPFRPGGDISIALLSHDGSRT